MLTLSFQFGSILHAGVAENAVLWFRKHGLYLHTEAKVLPLSDYLDMRASPQHDVLYTALGKWKLTTPSFQNTALHAIISLFCWQGQRVVCRKSLGYRTP